jgi:hypothetical protein
LPGCNWLEDKIRKDTAAAAKKDPAATPAVGDEAEYGGKDPPPTTTTMKALAKQRPTQIKIKSER